MSRGFALATVLAALTAQAQVERDGELLVVDGTGLARRERGGWCLDDPRAVLARLGAVVDGAESVVMSPGWDNRCAFGRHRGVRPGDTGPRALLVPRAAPSGAAAFHVLAHEWAHGWLALPPRGTGLVTTDGFHWSPLLQSDGSVLGGLAWEELGDGRFRVAAREVRLGPLDLFFLGLAPLPARDWFVLEGARRADGGREDARLAPGDVVTARKRAVLREELLSAGPRRPRRADRELHSVFVLVTAPGARPEPQDLGRLDELRRLWEASFPAFASGHAGACTSPGGCEEGRPSLGVALLVEGEPSDRDGIAEPGEGARVRLEVRREGTTPLEPRSLTVRVGDAAPVERAVGFEAGAVAEVEVPVRLPLSACGSPLPIVVEGRGLARTTRTVQLGMTEIALSAGGAVSKGQGVDVALPLEAQALEAPVVVYRTLFDARRPESREPVLEDAVTVEADRSVVDVLRVHASPDERRAVPIPAGSKTLQWRSTAQEPSSDVRAAIEQVVVTGVSPSCRSAGEAP